MRSEGSGVRGQSEGAMETAAILTRRGKSECNCGLQDNVGERGNGPPPYVCPRWLLHGVPILRLI